jgi:glucokinase
VKLVGAIDIGATKALLAVGPLPLDGWDVRAPTLRIESPHDPATFANLLAEGLRTLAAATGGDLVAVGVGTPGPLDRAAGLIVHSPNQGWHNVPLGPLLAERLGVPVVMDDDANTGALGETILGAGKGADPCAYVALGTGLGTGIVIGGAVVHGAHEAGGEMGHLVVDPSGPRCGCGHHGCVEAYAAGGGLERAAARAWPRGRRSDGTRAPRNAEEVFRAARAGDLDAALIVEQATEALARCFGAILAAVDPAVIVIGGSLGLGQRSYVTRAARRARRYAIAESGSRLAVVRAALGNHSVLAGAAVLGARAAAGEAGGKQSAGHGRSQGNAG